MNKRKKSGVSNKLCTCDFQFLPVTPLACVRFWFLFWWVSVEPDYEQTIMGKFAGINAMEPLKKIAFDLDETLGVPLIEGSKIIGWQLRPGAKELLSRLCENFILCLWSVSNRSYVNKALAFCLEKWFSESYSWDEMPCRWKDIRKVNAAFLVDDSPEHREEARHFNLAKSYIVVPAYGSPEDTADPLGWVRLVEGEVFVGSDQEQTIKE